MHRKNLFQTVYLSFSFLLFTSGALLSFLFYQESLAEHLAKIISQKRILFANFGLILVFLSLVLLRGLYQLSKSTALRVNVPGVVVEASPELISKVLEKKLGFLFGTRPFTFQTRIEDDYLEVTVHVPGMEKKQHDLFFKKLKKEVRSVLKKHFFYKKDFQLAILFK